MSAANGIIRWAYIETASVAVERVNIASLRSSIGVELVSKSTVYHTTRAARLSSAAGVTRQADEHANYSRGFFLSAGPPNTLSAYKRQMGNSAV